MKRILLLLVLITVGGLLGYPKTRAMVIEYAKIGVNALSAGVEATQNAMNNDLSECRDGTREQRIACTKRHEAPLDKLHPGMDSAGQQDKLYKAMEQ